MTDAIAERIRKIGGTTLRSIGHIARAATRMDNDAEYVEPVDMLAEFREDNRLLPRAFARPITCAKSTATSPPPA